MWVLATTNAPLLPETGRKAPITATQSRCSLCSLEYRAAVAESLTTRLPAFAVASIPLRMSLSANPPRSGALTAGFVEAPFPEASRCSLRLIGWLTNWLATDVPTDFSNAAIEGRAADPDAVVRETDGSDLDCEVVASTPSIMRASGPDPIPLLVLGSFNGGSSEGDSSSGTKSLKSTSRRSRSMNLRVPFHFLRI